jgi:hypothetical protein
MTIARRSLSSFALQTSHPCGANFRDSQRDDFVAARSQNHSSEPASDRDGKKHAVEGDGGLVIDYKSRNSQQTCRLVLGFNDLGMWIQRQSTLDEE